jgi:hypothetical protein
MNLGIGAGGLPAGSIADVQRPGTFVGLYSSLVVGVSTRVEALALAAHTMVIVTAQPAASAPAGALRPSQSSSPG